ncbi:MAG TPA: alpha/beta hydrolase [Methylomirabilota bacterium]|nr:alpha/beta hydrolase [Methylomirabilota bacterium]
MDRRRLRRVLLPDLSLARLCLSVAFIYGSIALLVWLLADRMIFLPPPAQYQDDAGILKLRTATGERISAIDLPNPAADYTVLYSHGNAEDLGVIRPLLPALRDLGFAVLAYDYRGYGTSDGRPSERAAYEDIDAAYEYLTRQRGLSPQRIILYGRSVGAGPAVDLAVRQPVGGLVLESSFTAAFRVLTRVPVLPFDKFQNLAKIPRVGCPVLVMHGLADDIIPAEHGRRLFAAAREPKQALWVPGAGHNDFMWVAGARWAQALREFALLLRKRQPAVGA